MDVLAHIDVVTCNITVQLGYCKCRTACTILTCRVTKTFCYAVEQCDVNKTAFIYLFIYLLELYDNMANECFI